MAGSEMIPQSPNDIPVTENLWNDAQMRIRRELETSEELLAQSQRDNEEKYAEVQRLKAYTKDLEALLDRTLGSDWPSDHGINKPSTHLVDHSSTPLPRPCHLRHSTSIIFSGRRACQARPRPVSFLDTRTLPPLEGIFENLVDDTPTGALRRFQSSTPAPMSSLKVKGKPGLITQTSARGVSDEPRQKISCESSVTTRAPPPDDSPHRLALDMLNEVERRLEARVSSLQGLKNEAIAQGSIRT